MSLCTPADLLPSGQLHDYKLFLYFTCIKSKINVRTPTLRLLLVNMEGGSVEYLQKLKHPGNSNLGSLEIEVSSTGWVATGIAELPAITSCFRLSVKIQVFLTPGSPPPGACF